MTHDQKYKKVSWQKRVNDPDRKKQKREMATTKMVLGQKKKGLIENTNEKWMRVFQAWPAM